MPQAYILDQPLYPTEKLAEPFALTDLLLANASAEKQAFLHFWQFSDTIILGMKDTRVPFLSDGLSSLEQDGLQPVVRNSGGLGVIADQGILNISLIFPHPKDHKLTIDEGYERMLELTRKAFPEASIAAYEVPESYCPGTYDLSIHGKKIAGIAQRRVKEGIAVMMYLSVNGDQQTRGESMRRFYRASLKEAFGTTGYPPVDPASMATLEDQLKGSFSIEEVKKRFIKEYKKEYCLSYDTIDEQSSSVWRSSLSEAEWQKKLLQIKQRNQSIKEHSHDSIL